MLSCSGMRPLCEAATLALPVSSFASAISRLNALVRSELLPFSFGLLAMQRATISRQATRAKAGRRGVEKAPLRGLGERSSFILSKVLVLRDFGGVRPV